MLKNKRDAIALLITVLFIIAITLAIGLGLKQVKEASGHVENESFLLQTSTLLDDVLTLLRTSKELDAIDSSEAFYEFLNQFPLMLPEYSGVKVMVGLKSARSRFNINSLTDANATVNESRKFALEQYLNRNMVNISFVDLLLDSMGKVRQDGYRSDIFNEKPYLFRDYIASRRHMEEIIDSYMKIYHDKSVKNINYDNLFYYSSDRNLGIDVNYATAEVWEMILGCDSARALELSMGAGSGIYKTIEDIGLSDEEKEQLLRFNPKFDERFLDVTVEIVQDEKSAKIGFEYDMKTKKGSNFVYDI
ncbi:hypothetical protein KJ877_03490 [bacterium]|nr:hypothetical protein [bacterium]MBU1990573.1 hypothetical protein [bacterium]